MLPQQLLLPKNTVTTIANTVTAATETNVIRRRSLFRRCIARWQE
jgi:hypothetical protein